MEADVESTEPDAKKPRLSGAQRKKLAKEEQKKRRGANKGRKFARAHDQVELCRQVASGKECQHGKE
jgi:tRNA-dihydrouridine synthase 3